MATIAPIKIRDADAESDVRARHEYMENRLNALGEETVRTLMATGGFAPQMHPFVVAWLGGARLETKEDEAKKKAEAQH